MGFSLVPTQGAPDQLASELEHPAQNPREEEVVASVKKAIEEIVNTLGGYLSVSANGNLNPVAGMTGDVINIYITSLPENVGYTSTENAVTDVQSPDTNWEPSHPEVNLPTPVEQSPAEENAVVQFEGESIHIEPVAITESTNIIPSVEDSSTVIPVDQTLAAETSPSIQKDIQVTEPPLASEETAEKSSEPAPAEFAPSGEPQVTPESVA